MAMTDDLPSLFERVLDDAGGLVLRAADADLRILTPCTDWDLGALIGHMVGQNDGFASAVREGDAPVTAYAAPRLTAADVPARWTDSAARLRAAFRTAMPQARVRLAELDLEVDVPTALGMQLLDNAVHAWDVAAALGADYRPDEAIARVVHESARMIAARPGGTPGVFAPARRADTADLWTDALRLLGR